MHFQTICHVKKEHQQSDHIQNINRKHPNITYSNKKKTTFRDNNYLSKSIKTKEFHHHAETVSTIVFLIISPRFSPGSSFLSFSIR